VSYDRILELENQIATSLCNSINVIGLVCPHQLHHSLFTIGALDNLDHNPSSTTSKDSFHGTGISFFQFPTTCNEGTFQAIANTISGEKKFKLPDSYTVVPAVVLKKESVVVPHVSTTSELVSHEHCNEAVQIEHNWLKHAMEVISKNELDKGEQISWAAYHTFSCKIEVVCTSINQLLPLFYEHAASAAMIKHGITVQTKATQFLSPGQIPVVAFDAPLFAIAKLVQWKWPDTHGEDKCVTMIGGLHIEMTLWSTYRDYLDGSGWVSALAQAGVASTSTVESFLKASHLMKTRNAHQVSALALVILQEKAFSQTNDSFDYKQEWKENMRKTSPMFLYWDTVFNLELAGLIFVRVTVKGIFHFTLILLKNCAMVFCLGSLSLC